MKRKVKEPTKKKVTYYIDPLLVARLKHLSVDLDRNCSDLVNEAIQKFVIEEEVRKDYKEKSKRVKKVAK
ncbi:hypothetical protein ES703_62768 [subsurface metagenome]